MGRSLRGRGSYRKQSPPGKRPIHHSPYPSPSYSSRQDEERRQVHDIDIATSRPSPDNGRGQYHAQDKYSSLSSPFDHRRQHRSPDIYASSPTVLKERNHDHSLGIYTSHRSQVEERDQNHARDVYVSDYSVVEERRRERSLPSFSPYRLDRSQRVIMSNHASNAAERKECTGHFDDWIEKSQMPSPGKSKDEASYLDGFSHRDSPSMYYRRKYLMQKPVDVNVDGNISSKYISSFEPTIPRNNLEEDTLGSVSSALDGHCTYLQKSPRLDDGFARELFMISSNDSPVLNSGKTRANNVPSSAARNYNVTHYNDDNLRHREHLGLPKIPLTEHYKEEERTTYSSSNVAYPVLPDSPSDFQSQTTKLRREQSSEATNKYLPLPSDGFHVSSFSYSDSLSHDQYNRVPNFQNARESKDVIYPRGTHRAAKGEHPEYGYHVAGWASNDLDYPSDGLYREMQPNTEGDNEKTFSSRKRSKDSSVKTDNDMKSSIQSEKEGRLWNHQYLQELGPSYLNMNNKIASERDVESISSGSKYLEFGARVSEDKRSSQPRGAYGFGMEAGPGLYKERLKRPLSEYNLDICRLDVSHQGSVKVEEDNYDPLDEVQKRKRSLNEELSMRDRTLTLSSGGRTFRLDVSQQRSLKVEEDKYNPLDEVQKRKCSLNEELIMRDPTLTLSSARGTFKLDVSHQQSLEAEDDKYGPLDVMQKTEYSMNEEMTMHDPKITLSSARDICRLDERHQQSLKVEKGKYNPLVEVHNRKYILNEEMTVHDPRITLLNTGDLRKLDGSHQRSSKIEEDNYSLLDEAKKSKYIMNGEMTVCDPRITLSSGGDICRVGHELTDVTKHSRQGHELTGVTKHSTGEDSDSLPSTKPSAFSRIKYPKLIKPHNESVSPKVSASQRLSSLGQGFEPNSHSMSDRQLSVKKRLRPALLNVQDSDLLDWRHNRPDKCRKSCLNDQYGKVNADKDRHSRSKVLSVKTDPAEGSEEFKQLVHKAFLRFSKHLNETSAQRRRFKEQGKAGTLLCSVCGSLSKEFMETRSLASHAFSSKAGLRSDHLGLHKAICVLMGWESDVITGSTWVLRVLPNAEALSLKEDLILWPPLVIIHNSSIGNKNPDEQKVVTVEAMVAILKGLGFSLGTTKVCRGKPANQSILVVKFNPTFSELQEAIRLHKYFAENKRGRQEFRLITVNNDPSSEESTGPSVARAMELFLYGYMGISDDLDKLEIETKKRCLVKSKKEIQTIADAPLKAE